MLEVHSEFLMLRASTSVELKSKFRGCILGAIVGDCMGGRFDASIEPYAIVSSRTEPSHLRNQIPRSGGRSLFPYGSDTLMMKTVGWTLLEHKHKSGYELDPKEYPLLESALLERLQSTLKQKVHESSSIEWGVGTRHFLEQSSGSGDSLLRSNCGLTRSVIAGLVDVDLSHPICSATHKHDSAVQGARVVAQSIHQAVHSGTLVTEDDILLPPYKNLVHTSRILAAGRAFSEMDDFDTKIQERFFNRFGRDTSAKCAVAGMVFALHRTVHSLPHVDASSKEYLDRIRTVTEAGEKKQNSKLSRNILGNSNRLDSESLFGKLTPSIEQDLPVALAVNWAISLGGDTRSQGFLAGALAGALWGEAGIPEEWLVFSEGVGEGRRLADELYRDVVG